MPVVTQINTNGLDNSVTDEKLNNSDTFNLTGTTIFNSGSTTYTMPNTRPSAAQVLQVILLGSQQLQSQVIKGLHGIGK